METQGLRVLLIEDNPIFSGIGAIVLANAKVSYVDVAETSPKAIGFVKQRDYSLIIVNEIADLLPNQGEHPIEEGWLQYLMNFLKMEKESRGCLIIGLYKTQQSSGLWRDLTKYVFHQFDFYEGNALQQTLQAK